jgi:hypothetical protein
VYSVVEVHSGECVRDGADRVLFDTETEAREFVVSAFGDDRVRDYLVVHVDDLR